MRPSALTTTLACLLGAGCATSYHMDIVRVTLAAGSPTDARSGLKLISVDPDGTAHIQWTAVGETFELRPQSPHEQVSLRQLETTDPAAQTASLRALLCDGGR